MLKVLLATVALAAPQSAHALQVAFVRQGNRTVLTLLNDFKGDLKEFTLIVPVPVALKKNQIRVIEKRVLDRLDALSAPKLVEQFDSDPCQPSHDEAKNHSRSQSRTQSLKVTNEASYTAGEYDIAIVSAQDSETFEARLIKSGLNVPKGIKKALEPYTKRGFHFVVAQVNIKEQAKTGLRYLRPIQISFEHDHFMLPIQLGIANAEGTQDSTLYMITKNGRVESSNYRTLKIPSDVNLAAYIKDDFATFYNALIDHAYNQQEGKVLFTEYFSKVETCDTCLTDALTPAELKELGVFWLDERTHQTTKASFGRPEPVQITRLHLRSPADQFPTDLSFIETKDTEHFQSRYILQHPFKGRSGQCAQAKEYYAGLIARQEGEALAVARLSNWKIEDVRRKMGLNRRTGDQKGGDWWTDLWGKDKKLK